MLQNKFEISIDFFQQENLRILQMREQLLLLKERKSKLNKDYRKKISDLFLEYIDFKDIISNKFSITLKQFKDLNSIYYDSSTLEETEEQFKQILRFFKDNPEFLAHVLLNFDDKHCIDDEFIDFVVLHFYPRFLNLYCSCKQPNNLFIFVQIIIEEELKYAQSYENFESFSVLTEKIFKSLIKTNIVEEFFQKFIKDLRNNTTINENFLHCESKNEEDEEDFSILDQTQKLNKSNSGKYQSILTSYKIFASKNFQDSSLIINKNSLDFFNQEQYIEIENKIFNLNVFPEAMKILQNCIKNYLSIELKFFFYCIFKICDKNKISKKKVMNYFFFRGLLITKVNQEKDLVENEEFQKELQKLIGLILALSPLSEQDQYSYKCQFENLQNLIVDIPQSFIEQIEKFVTNQRLSSEIDDNLSFRKKSKSLKNVDSLTFQRQISSIHSSKNVQFQQKILPQHSCAFLPNQNLKLTQMNFTKLFQEERRKSVQNPNKQQWKPEKKRISILTKDLSIPSINEENYNIVGDMKSSIQQKSQITSTKKLCNFHMEAVCVSYQNLGFLLDLYSESGQNNSTDHLSIQLSQIIKKLTTHEKQANDLNQIIKKQGLYFLFMQDLKENEPLKMELPRNSIGRVFDLAFIDENLISIYEGKNLYDFLHYYKNYMFFDKNQIELNQKKKFFDLTYNLNFKNIYLVNNKKFLYSQPSKSDQENKTAFYKLYKSLKQYQQNADQFNTLLQNKNLDYVKKQKEIILCQNEVLHYRQLKKKLFKLQVYKKFDYMAKSISLDLCFGIQREKILAKSRSLDQYELKLIHNCTYNLATNKMYEFKTKYGKYIKEHYHFKKLNEMLKFFKRYGFVHELINYSKYINLFNELITYIQSLYKKNLDNYFERVEKKEIQKIYNNKQILDTLLENYLSSKFIEIFFPFHSSLKDKGFRINCQMLNFIQLKNLFKHKKADQMQEYLDGIIDNISAITRAQCYGKKFEQLNQTLDKIVEVVSEINGKIIGSEELDPIFTYCILKAKPLNWISNLRLMEIFLNQDMKKGQKGFALRTINIATTLIEKADRKIFKCDDFLRNLLKNEALFGVHFMKSRQQRNTKVIIKNTKDYYI